MPLRSSSEVALIRAVRRLGVVLARLERHAAHAAEVSVSQLRILLQLQNRSILVSALAKEQALAISTVTRNIDLLLRNGWVQKQVGTNDQRTVQISLSPSGEALAARLDELLNQQLLLAFREFHATDRLERTVALDRVGSALLKYALPREGADAPSAPAVLD